MVSIRHASVAIGIIVIAASLLYGGVATTRANDRPPLHTSHKEDIAANCEGAKFSLRQLHRSDASLRVNRGQSYEYIGSKLMTRLNSRLALNQLDAGQLVVIAARYNQLLADFRGLYKTYEERLSAVLGIDCAKNPEEFYYQVVEARKDRRAVHASVTSLNTTVEEFYNEFGRFALGYGVAVGGQNE